LSKQVLIIIDPQEDFTSAEGSYAKRHSGITQIAAAKQNINKILKLWNWDNYVIIKSDYRPNQFGDGLFMCIPGTPGHNLDKDLYFLKQAPIFIKSEHSAFSSQQFREYIKSQEIDTILLCGFLAEYCVKQTAIDALKASYKIQLVEDCIGTGDDVQYRKQQMMQDFIAKGAELTNSKYFELRSTT